MADFIDSEAEESSENEEMSGADSEAEIKEKQPKKKKKMVVDSDDEEEGMMHFINHNKLIVSIAQNP